jgi:hypothetical protein
MVFVQWKQIVVVIRATMEHAALEIDGGIDQGEGSAAIFGLHMQGVRSEFEIGVVPEDHLLPLCSQAR